MDWHYESSLQEVMDTEVYPMVSKVDKKYVSSHLLPTNVLEKAEALIAELFPILRRFDASLIGDSEQGGWGFMIEGYEFVWDTLIPPMPEKVYVLYDGWKVGLLTLIKSE